LTASEKLKLKMRQALANQGTKVLYFLFSTTYCKYSLILLVTKDQVKELKRKQPI
jgi:hypothetical protein